MLQSQLVDLDELIILCKSAEAKVYIVEAVACYKAGSFRASILTTWIAVVFDFIDKLRQLAMSGDSNAEQQIKHLEQYLRDNNVTELLKFERSMLDKAKDDFEFISQVEFDELTRLEKDRDKCAHPAMRSVDEPYHPTAETARYHLRNAVVHMLQHPPTHGKAVLDKLIDQVKSNYFPDEVAKARIYFQNTPLVRPRAALLRNFVVMLIKNILSEDLDNLPLIIRYITALQAVSALHFNDVQEIMAQRAGQLIAKVPEADYVHIVSILYYMPEFWQFITDDMRLKLETYAEKVPESDFDSISWIVFRTPFFKKASLTLLNSLEDHHFSSVVSDYGRFKDEPPPEVLDKAVELYANSVRFEQANARATYWLIPLSHYLQKRHVATILRAADENLQVQGSFEFVTLLKTLIRISTEFEAMIAEYVKKWEGEGSRGNLKSTLFPEEMDNIPF